MQPHTIRLPEDLLEDLKEEAAEEGVARAEYIRTILQQRGGYDELRDEYEGRIEELEHENERLRNQLAATNRRVDEHQDLVEYVEEERSMQQRREEREQRRAEAGVLTRAKWWITGMPADEETDGE